MSSTRSTSPDPLTLPTSPIVAHHSPHRHSASKPHAPRSSNVVPQSSSPKKSFVMDTGKAGADSPWRIRVTVQAEPTIPSSLARKNARTRKVPLKAAAGGSPAKAARRARVPRSVEAASDESDSAKSDHNQRKRKSTPVRRRPARLTPTTTEEDDNEALAQQTTGSTSSPRRTVATRALALASTERSRRLGRAREELDRAVREAVRPQPEEDNVEDAAADADIGPMPGDMTLVENEDFTMVSIETLQSMKQSTSLLDDSKVDAGDHTGISVSYMPSSPPGPHQEHEIPPRHTLSRTTNKRDSQKGELDSNVKCPDDHSSASERHRTSSPQVPLILGAARPNGATNASEAQTPADSEPLEWRLKRQEVSKRVRDMSPQDVIVIADDYTSDSTCCDKSNSGVQPAENEDDIWVEEGSRSLAEDDSAMSSTRGLPSKVQLKSRPPSSNDLMIDQQLKPLRSKIPRTWRRTSGLNFSYIDSPKHREPHKAAETETDAPSRKSSGVLTPPTTDDEEGLANLQKDEASSNEGPASQPSQITQIRCSTTSSRARENMPSAATRLSEIISPMSDSSSGTASSDGGDTGIFWQSNLPNVFQRPRHIERPRLARRKKAQDISELLESDRTDGIPRTPGTLSAGREARAVNGVSVGDNSSKSREGIRHLHIRSAQGTRNAASGKDRTDPGPVGKEKVVGSHLRRSLLKSSKVGDPVPLSRPLLKLRDDDCESSLSESVACSFESKASDQRQLLAEMRGTSICRDRRGLRNMSRESVQSTAPIQRKSNKDTVQSSSIYSDDDISIQQSEGYTQDELTGGPELNHNGSAHYASDPARSYEEHLNIESPQKILVKFNDSESNLNPTNGNKSSAPLYCEQLENGVVHSKEAEARSPPSITLISKRKQFKSDPTQPGILSRLSTNFWAAVVRPVGPAEEPVFSQSLRTHIRSRYGVLSECHPWTFAHQRVVHRMLNSCTSNKSDSIIPKPGSQPLPSALARVVGTKVTNIGDFDWTFTEQHGHVVDSFMQVLVTPNLIEAMANGDIDFIGDPIAALHRGQYGDDHGDDIVYADDQIPEGLPADGSKIFVSWVVRALGNCISGDMIMANRAAAEEERREKIEADRTAWEARNGFQYDDEDE